MYLFLVSVTPIVAAKVNRLLLKPLHGCQIKIVKLQYCIFTDYCWSSFLFFVKRWGPQLEQATYKNRQRLYLSEQASASYLKYKLVFWSLWPLNCWVRNKTLWTWGPNCSCWFCL